jgi:hypothetical protein
MRPSIARNEQVSGSSPLVGSVFCCDLQVKHEGEKRAGGSLGPSYANVMPVCSELVAPINRGCSGATNRPLSLHFRTALFSFYAGAEYRGGSPTREKLDRP